MYALAQFSIYLFFDSNQILGQVCLAWTCFCEIPLLIVFRINQTVELDVLLIAVDWFSRLCVIIQSTLLFFTQDKMKKAYSLLKPL